MAIAILLLGGCGDPGQPDSGDAPSRPKASPTAPGDPITYEANAMVLESPDGGPMLCLGVVLDSLPPQCGDVPIEGWDWDAVEGEERRAGVTWGGSYHVTGTFDGDRFKVVGAPGPPDPRLDPLDEFSPESPCDDPPGDPEAGSSLAAGEVLGPLERESDYAGGWITWLDEPEAETDVGPVILNAGFTGDLERHEAELRERWQGALCVFERERSMDELRRIQEDAGALAEELGARTLTSDIDVIENRAELHVIFLDASARAALEKRYPPEELRVTTALKPVG